MPVIGFDERPVFTGQSINTSTYTYSTEGWISRKSSDEIMLQFKLATLTATSLTVRLEGKSIAMSAVASANSEASLFCKTYTAKHNIGTVERIQTKAAKVRLGALIDINSSPNNVYANLIFIEKR